MGVIMQCEVGSPVIMNNAMSSARLRSECHGLRINEMINQCRPNHMNLLSGARVEHYSSGYEQGLDL